MQCSFSKEPIKNVLDTFAQRLNSNGVLCHLYNLKQNFVTTDLQTSTVTVAKKKFVNLLEITVRKSDVKS